MSNTLTDAQANLKNIEAEQARINTVLAQSLGAREAEAAHLRDQLSQLDAQAARNAAEWSAAVIAGAPAGEGPPMHMSPEAEGLRARLAEAEKLAATERVARAPLLARRDELVYLRRLAEEAVEKANSMALRTEARRIFQEFQAAMQVASEIRDKYEAVGYVLSPADWAALPMLPDAGGLLARSPHRVAEAKADWQAFRVLVMAMPEATLEDASKFRAFQAHRAREQAAAQ